MGFGLGLVEGMKGKRRVLLGEGGRRNGSGGAGEDKERGCSSIEGELLVGHRFILGAGLPGQEFSKQSLRQTTFGEPVAGSPPCVGDNAKPFILPSNIKVTLVIERQEPMPKSLVH